VHDLAGLLVGTIDDRRGVAARLADLLLHARVGIGEILLRALGGGKSFLDAPGALVHRGDQRRPDEFHREPDEDREDDHLGDERCIDIHESDSSADGSGTGAGQGVAACDRTLAENGSTKIRYIAIPTPMIGIASIRPTSRNILPCSIGTSSGWRAELSRNLPPIRPMPIAAPMPPRPSMRPAARAVMPSTVASALISIVCLRSTAFYGTVGWK